MSKKLLLVILPLAIVAFAANDVHWLSDPDAPRIPAAPGAGGGYKLPTPPAGDQPPFGTVVNRWSLTMSGGYAGSGITWQRDSGKFFLMDQGATGSFRVWKLDPSDPSGTITQVAWQFKDLGSGSTDIPWSMAWDDDSHCFWISNILDGSVYAGCYYLRYEWVSGNSRWEWAGGAGDSWYIGDGSNGGGLSMLWMAGSEKWIDRSIDSKDVFGCAPVHSSPSTGNYVDLFDPYTKTDHGRVANGDQTSERGCALVPWDSLYILTCGWNRQNFVKRDSTGYVLANVSAPTYGPADWAVMVPEFVNITDTVYVYCINNNSTNSFEQVSGGMTWGQLPSVNRSTIRPTRLLSPIGVVDSGQVITPRCEFRNMSDSLVDSVDLHFLIDNEMDVVIYHDSTYMLNWPAGSTYVFDFTPWVPVGRDSMGCMSWCYSEEDTIRRDDTISARFLVRVRDVAITAVNEPVPGDTIDPGLVYPQVEIFNYGNLTMTFPMIFNIGPYFDTVWVVNLLAGGARTVTALNPWNATAGIWLCNFRARVAGDIHPENNDTSFVLIVRGDIDFDVATDEILVPQGVIDTGAFTPQARYANYGTVALTCTTYCWIEDTVTDVVIYYDDSPVMLLPDGGTSTVAYEPCTLMVEGPYMVSCSIHLATDQNWLNNAIHKPFRVGAGAEYDVLVSAILAPTSLVDSSSSVLPRAEVFNAGLYAETFPVYFQLPDYEATRTITLDPGDYDTVSFPIWRASYPPGSYSAVAFTMLVGDLNPNNDTVVKPFTIQKRDLGVSAIYAPKDTVPDATMVEPSCQITNYGNTVETFQVQFNIGLFSARETVIGLVGGNSETVVFSDSWLSSPGEWVSRFEVIPNPADPNPGNNVMIDTVYVAGDIDYDVGVVSINSPTNPQDTTGMVDVEATVRNYSTAGAQTFWTYFSIFDPTNALVYSDEVQTVDLGTGASAELTFDQVDLNEEGWYTARCSTFLAEDQKWTNNVVVLMFEVRGQSDFPYGWFEVARMPTSPSGRPVKRGGWAVAHEGNNLIYVAKGYKTTDFYSFAPAPPFQGGGTWTELNGMPYQKHPLWSSKPPRKGAKGANGSSADNGNLIFVTQGNNTLGWWAYDISMDSWNYLADIPLGINRKKVKGGTDLVYVPGEEGDFLYCLKGYKTEFYRFNLTTETWEPLEDAPTGARNKWDKGSWLVWDGDRYLYAHKAKYHELWRYDLVSQSWDSSLAGMPFLGMMGRRKKSKDGGSAAYHDGFLWALKGGNTQEWWKYEIATNTWTEKETMPAFGSTGRKKRVKYGADVVHWGGSAPLFFTAKGNKTVEFWGYLEEPPTAFSAKPSRSGIAGSVTPIGDLSFDVVPNPLAGRVATVRYSLPKAGPVSISIFDVAGRSVSSRTLLASRTGAVNLDLRSLSAGIYLVRLNGDGFEQTRKLVVQQ